MIWIVGECAERIDNADELLESFLEGFHEESTQVQLPLLTAIVELSLKKPSETQELGTSVWNFTNKALQHMTDSAIQFNENSFGVIPSTPLAIHTPLTPNQSIDVSLPLNTLGPVTKREPLKNNIDVTYFSCLIPLNVLFAQDGKMERQAFLATWKDIPLKMNFSFRLRNVI
ncbi:hypothetical protein MJG53_008913 [Ovis ammon polii x Ovis aries]|uniref:Uncharacterized protein n=1 Tax=Ovis ammon polii x Ovis aries TaxID=2918886 RepID=A0ACB9UXN0_9CETA|nr:hypothetical protein MJT46_008547 [Ovis ammon polii x Ovis aries]KAI4582362.1 hypothetical protein MJG53_008913 [Ovis ammon polii x Ovis aries]